MKNYRLNSMSRRILFSSMFLTSFCVGIPLPTFAEVNGGMEIYQNATVGGIVVDANGEPVIGANVMVKGTNNGTITDIDGKFTLSNAKGVLVVSFIGYKTQEIQINGNEKNLNIVL